MPSLPLATDFTGAAVTEGGFKTALTNLRGYLSALFGDDGTAATARNTLGVVTPDQMLAYVAAVAADRATAQASAASAQASWTAALAANPDLKPAVRMNPSTISADLTVPSSYNAYSAGPLTIGEGVTVTLADNSRWTIL